MGQYEILTVLKQRPKKWFTVKELSSIICKGESSTRDNVVRLIKNNYVKHKLVHDSKGRRFMLSYKFGLNFPI